MKLSIITPTHDSSRLNELWDTIATQQNVDVEWVVACNNGAKYENADPRVKVAEAPIACGTRVGALKRFASESSTGDVIIEVDHDDLLLPGALEKIAKAADSKDNAFIYSDTLETSNGESKVFGEEFGWRHYNFDFNGKTYTINSSFTPSPRSLAEIFFSPNHVRAWTRKAYLGHDQGMSICDDQDLVARTYIAGSEFIHIPEPIYWQRVSDKSTQIILNSQIQEQQAMVRDRYIIPLAMRWSQTHGLGALDFGGAHSCPPGFIPVDICETKNGIKCDLSKGRLPFADQSVGIIRCQDFLEHIPIGKVVPLMNEMHRVLAHNGILWTNTPSTDGRGAFCDPTHVSFWNELSFRYYTNRQFAAYVPEVRCRFQKVSLKTYFPSDWHEEAKIPYVQCVMAANHGGRMAGKTEI